MNVVRVREPDALRQSSDATGLSEAKIKERLDDFGKSLGPPWTQDEKVATLAALIALS
jgi:hypothetical protein